MSRSKGRWLLKANKWNWQHKFLKYKYYRYYLDKGITNSSFGIINCEFKRRYLKVIKWLKNEISGNGKWFERK